MLIEPGVADIQRALLEGAIGGAVVLLGVLVAEWFIRLRRRATRREKLLSELRIALPKFRDSVRGGGILAVSPGSAQGQEAGYEAIRVLGLLTDLAASVGVALWGKGRRFREKAVELAALTYVGITHSPLRPHELEKLDTDGLDRLVYGHPRDKRFGEVLQGILADRDRP